MQPDFSFQDRCIEKIHEARVSGVRRLVACAPTGAGKTVMLCRLFERELEAGGRPVVYTNRKVLRRQLHQTLAKFGIDAGVRAAGYTPDLNADAQVSSINTERRRSLDRFHPWSLHDATLAVVDEIHANKSATAQKILDFHEENAFILGLTATPVGLGRSYTRSDGTTRRLFDKLIILISNSELRARGVIVPCDVFAPSEIDMQDVAIGPDGDYVAKQMQQRFHGVRHVVIANVLEYYHKLNPLQEPTLLFAPGVPESKWFAEDLTRQGVATEHIDAHTPEEDRLEVFRRLENGETKILTNYAIVAEGFDCPIVSHIILCRPMAATSTYVQCIGRALRAYPGKTHATLHDHVGAFHRPGLGSPNQDRDWKLDDENKALAKDEKKTREDREAGETKEPVRCPKCSRVLAVPPRDGSTCVCGHSFKRSVRMVIQTNGALKRKLGSTVERKPPKDDTYFFRSAIFAAARSRRTVGQAYGHAMMMKRESTGDATAWISREDCTIRIPQKTERAWDLLVTDVYPWTRKRANAK